MKHEETAKRLRLALDLRGLKATELSENQAFLNHLLVNMLMVQKHRQI